MKNLVFQSLCREESSSSLQYLSFLCVFFTVAWNTSLLIFLVTRCVEFFDHTNKLFSVCQQGVQVKDKPHKIVPFPCHFNYHLCLWPPGYRLEVSMTVSLGSINLLKQFTELKEILTFIHLLKDMIKKTDKLPDGRDA